MLPSLGIEGENMRIGLAAVGAVIGLLGAAGSLHAAPSCSVEALNALRGQLGRPALKLAGPQSAQVSTWSSVAARVLASRTPSESSTRRLR